MLTLNQFPKQMADLELDFDHLNRALINGCFEERVQIGKQERSFLIYIPKQIEYARPCIIAAPPSGADPLAFLEHSGLARLADENMLYTAVLTPPKEGWKLTPDDPAFMNAVYEAVQRRDYYVTIQDNIYACGAGEGAAVAQLAAAAMSSDWSGLMTFGDLGSTFPGFSSVSKKEHDQGELELMIDGQKAQLPVWMMISHLEGINSAAVQYWSQQNHVLPDPLSGQGADDIWMPSPVRYLSEINEESIAQVRVTEQVTEISYSALSTAWRYIGMARRHRSFRIKNLRYTKDPLQAGASLHTLKVDGMTRRWYEYVPEGCTPDRKWPLVVVMHGRGGSAETFFDITCMSSVAHDRKFIAVFPEAGIHQQKKDGLRNVLLWNGIYRNQPIDDVAFIRQMVENISGRLPIDRGRIYACGQSSGGMMTDVLCTCASDIFAACASWSALMSKSRSYRDFEPTAPLSPTLFLYGDRDNICISKEPNPDFPFYVHEEVHQVLLQKLERYHLKKERFHTWKTYPITWYSYPNDQGVPMLTIGIVENMVHGNYPEESRISYDQFFSQFCKNEEGELCYRGIPVTSAKQKSDNI